MIISNQKDLKLYQQAANLSTQILAQLRLKLKPGIYPVEIDNLAKKLCLKHRVKPAFQGVASKDKVYDYATCISINDTVVHGAPGSIGKIKVGDLVKVDFGLIYQGLYTDHCFTVAIKKLTPSKKKLIQVAKDSVWQAVQQAVTGAAVGDLGSTMHSIALANGFDVLKQYTGHGIGRTLHDQPIIPAHGQPHTGVKLETGMVICVESQVVTGSDQVYLSPDGWSVKTKDKGNTAMFEYMVVVRPKAPLVLTPTFDWPIVV